METGLEMSYGQKLVTAEHFVLLSGTLICGCAVENPQGYCLRAGTIRQHADFPPRRQIWRRSA